MRKTTVNFIKENEEGTKVCSFELFPYEVPKGHNMNIKQWSASGRTLFQNGYRRLAASLGDARSTDAEKAVQTAMEFLNEAALTASETGKATWNSLYCAVSLNHLVWLSGYDHDEEAVEKRTEDMAQMLKRRIMAKYDKVRCLAMTSWPVPRWCSAYLKGKGRYVKITPEHLQCLLTAYACVLSHRNGITVRENGDHGITPILLQDEARSMASALLGTMYKKWAPYQMMFTPQEKRESNILLRATAMPVATGLARTLIMVTMPLDTAAIVSTELLGAAWPLKRDKLSAAKKAAITSQLFAGMACTLSDTHAGALDKTCYVWTRYFW